MKKFGGFVILALVGLMACGDTTAVPALPTVTALTLPTVTPPALVSTPTPASSPIATTTVRPNPGVPSNASPIAPSVSRPSLPATTLTSSPTSSANPNPTVNKSQTTGLLKGRLIASPACPDQPLASPCPPLVLSGRNVYVKDEAGSRTLQTLTTDATGNFQVELAPGKYRLEALLKGENDPGSPHLVNVVAGQTVQITLELDTGVR